jgi:hypothetical protein
MPPKVKSVEPVYSHLIDKIVFNILSNAKYVLQACKCKTLSDTHLKTVSLIQANILSQKICYVPPKVKRQTGGAVLPSEYWGNDSQSYHDITAIDPSKFTIQSNLSELSRAEIPSTFPIIAGGAYKTIVSVDQVKASIKEFQKQYPDTIGRVSPKAIDMIQASVTENIHSVMKKAVSKYGPSVTKAQLVAMCKSDASLFHLAV